MSASDKLSRPLVTFTPVLWANDFEKSSSGYIFIPTLFASYYVFYKFLCEHV